MRPSSLTMLVLAVAVAGGCATAAAPPPAEPIGNLPPAHADFDATFLATDDLLRQAGVTVHPTPPTDTADVVAVDLPRLTTGHVSRAAIAQARRQADAALAARLDVILAAPPAPTLPLGVWQFASGAVSLSGPVPGVPPTSITGDADAALADIAGDRPFTDVSAAVRAAADSVQTGKPAAALDGLTPADRAVARALASEAHGPLPLQARVWTAVDGWMVGVVVVDCLAGLSFYWVPADGGIPRAIYRASKGVFAIVTACAVATH